ncbi:MAG: flagellar hook basal-body protein [Planktomarina sp.]|nr:flagellar hook basal-body protein [Planktomarina sp.]|tara:strand:- start:725 stop:1537 length:813 start_codon:yes stop_codon:yes gene_type:complete
MFSVVKSGMDTALQELSVISNNISNANSTGFKKSSLSFSEFFNGTTAEGVSSAVTGKGASADDARRSDGQGALIEMGGVLDTAVVGNGYFMTQREDQIGFSVTRNGAFSLDADGFLKAQDGAFVLGMSAVDGEFVGVGDDVTALQRVQIAINASEEPLADLKVGNNGDVLAAFGEGDLVPVATIPLSIFSNPNGLKQLGGGSYSPTDTAGKMFLGSPNSAGFGNLESGYIEGSNVDITMEMTNMIKAQQQFSGAAKAMQANSDMIEKLTR